MPQPPGLALSITFQEGWGDLHSTERRGWERLGLRSAQEHKDRLERQPRNPRPCSPSADNSPFNRHYRGPPTHGCSAGTGVWQRPEVPACSPVEPTVRGSLSLSREMELHGENAKCLRCWGYRLWVYIPSLAVLITQPSSLLSKVRRPLLCIDLPTLTLTCKHRSPCLPWPAFPTPPF